MSCVPALRSVPVHRRRRSALLAGGAAALLLGVTGAGVHRSGAAAVASATTHPQDDHMGSTIGAHGGARAPRAGVRAQGAAAQASLHGVDVSSHQGAVDWTAAAAGGIRFAYVKATEGITYLNPWFGQQYGGSAAAGLIRGAYHFALPDRSPGAVQAAYLVDHGGGWTAGTGTLPPLLDIEYNPYGDTCYGLSPAAMSAWVADFSATIRARTGRAPVVYTNQDWWNTCTAGWGAGGDPLFVARYAGDPGVLPTGWSSWTLWQYSDQGPFPGDQDSFNGDLTALRALAGVAPGPVVGGAIGARWQALGGASGVLGRPLMTERATADGVGRYLHFERGSVFWSPATGAHEVHGAIREHWASLGWERSALGYPTTDELPTMDGIGRFNHFQGGSIDWTPSTGAHVLLTAVRDHWVALGGVRSFLGYPVSDQLTVAGGARAVFQGGAVYWSSSTGAHSVRGRILQAYVGLGASGGRLGLPVSDELPTVDGRESRFQHGIIHWHAATDSIDVTAT